MIYYAFLKHSASTGTQQGFTLMELLVTLSILSILATITIPTYRSYRERAYDIKAQIGLRSVALAEEAYYFDSEHYLDCKNSECETLRGVSKLDRDLLINISATPTGFTGDANHKRGSGKTYRWDSAQNGMLE